MSTVNFFLSKQERRGFFESCFEYRCRIIPHLHYGENSYYELKSIEEYHEYGELCPLISIVNDSYQQYPLEMDFFEKESKKTYFIKQRYGGPCIDFYSPVLAEIENKKIGPGLLSIYPFFYHSDQKITKSDFLSDFFNKLSLYIKGISTPIKIGSKKYWVGNDAQARFKEDEIEFVEINGFDWDEILK